MKLISLDKLYRLLLKIMDVYWQKPGITYIQRFKVNKGNFKFASPFIFTTLNYVCLLKTFLSLFPYHCMLSLLVALQFLFYIYCSFIIANMFDYCLKDTKYAICDVM
jgi:hypothetical protein